MSPGESATKMIGARLLSGDRGSDIVLFLYHDLCASSDTPDHDIAHTLRRLLPRSDRLSRPPPDLPLSVPGRPGRRQLELSCDAISSGNPYPFTNPPFYVISHGYDMDITTSGIPFGLGRMSYPFQVHILFFKKDIFGYTWYILNKKIAFGIYQVYLFMSYAIPTHDLSMS